MGKRGVSEVFGSVLIVSIVLLVAVSLIGFGYILVQDSSGSADDRTAQDSLVSLSERLDGVTTDELEGTTEWEPPEGTAGDFEAQPDEGLINVTAETNETYWQATAETGKDGDLVEADKQLGYESVLLGTIVHEASDGERTAFQGGGLFSKEAGTVRILRDPGIDIVDNRLAFDVIDISSVDHISQDELALERNAQTVGTSDVQQIVNEAMMKDGDVVAPAMMNVTVTSEFAEGWETYANSLDDVETVISGSEHPALADDQVRIVFGEFGEGIQPIDAEFADDIIYTGLSEFSPNLYEPDEGEIQREDDGFSVTDPTDDDDYLVSILYNDGDGPEWFVWDPEGADEKWVSAEEPDPDQRVLGDDDAPDVVAGVSGDEFNVANDTWVAAINVTNEDRELDTFREYLPEAYDGSGDDGILTNPVEIENPGEFEGNFAPFLEIESFDVTVVDDDGDPTGTDVEDDLQVNDEHLDLTVEVENVGSGEADEEPVALLQQTADDASDLDRDDAWIVDGDFSDVDVYDSDTVETTVETRLPGDYAIMVGTGTAHDALDDWNETFVRADGDGDYQIQDVDIDQAGVAEGDDVGVTAVIENSDSTNDGNQTIVLRGGPDDILLDSESDFEILSGEDKLVNFEWTTEIDRESEWDDIEVRTADDEEDATLAVDPSSSESAFEIEVTDYEETVEAGESVSVTAEITNEGDGVDQQLVTLRDDDGSLVFGDPAERTEELDTDGSDTVDLSWNTFIGDEGNEELTVETEDSSEEITINVEQSDELTAFELQIEAIDDDVEAGSELEVVTNVTNTLDEEVTDDVMLFDIEGNLVDVDEKTLGAEDTEMIELTWTPGSAFANQTDEITVATVDDEETAEVEVIESKVPASNFEIDADDIEEQVAEGEPVDVGVTIENTGDLADSQLVALSDFDGNTVDLAEDVELDPGEDTSLALTWTNPRDLREYSDTEELTIQTADDEYAAAVAVESQLLIHDVTPTPERVAEDEQDDIEFGVTLENTGESELTADVWLEDFDGNEVDTETVTVEDETAETLTWTLDPNDHPRTDNVTVRTADDSMEQRVVVERDGPDCGTVTYAGSGTSSDPYQVANVDQLQCINEHDLTANYVLVNDIDAHGTQHWNDGDGFEPIGDSSDGEFSGTLDGQQHEISGLYIDRPWEYDVGLIGRTDSIGSGTGGAVMTELRITDAEVYGLESVGAAAGNFGGTMENVSAAGYVEATDQRVGLVVGRGAGADLTNQLTARGTVVGGDASSVDRGIGAVVGRTSWDTELDTTYAVATVEGDTNVGGLMGSSSSNPSEFTQMYAANTVISDADNNDTAGAVTGLVEDSQWPYDRFLDSVYWDEQVHADPYGNNEDGNDPLFDWQSRVTDEMQGPSVLPDSEAENYPGVTTNDTEGTMAELDWEIWEPVFDIEDGEIVNEGYPVFRWELEAQGAVLPTIEETNSPIDEEETLEVNVHVENTNPSQVTQTVMLYDPDGNPVDAKDVSLDRRTAPDSSKEITMTWTTESGDSYDQEEIVVETDDSADSEPVTVRQAVDAQFDVEINDTTSPVVEGDEMDIFATVENTGEDSDTQQVSLLVDGTRITDAVEVEELAGGETRDLEFVWETSIGDTDVETLNVSSEDDSDQTAVEVTERDDAEFELEITDSPDQVATGDLVAVDVEVEHIGDVEYTQPILLDVEDVGTTDVETVSREPGDDSAEITLEWPTGTDDDGTKEITVETGDGDVSDSDSVEVTPLTAAGDFQVVDIDTNADEGESIEENENLLANATIKNQGNNTAEQIVELTVQGDTLAVEELTLEEDGSGEVEFTIDSIQTNPSIDEVSVKSIDDEQSQDVDIQSVSSSTDIDLEIVDVAPDATVQGAVEAGEEITATVEVTNNGDSQVNVVSLHARSGATKQLVDIELGETIDPGTSDTVDLSWQTLPGEGDDENAWELLAESQDAESESEEVWVGKLTDSVIGSPFEGGGTNIQINIDDIQIG